MESGWGLHCFRWGDKRGLSAPDEPHEVQAVPYLTDEALVGGPELGATAPRHTQVLRIAGSRHSQVASQKGGLLVQSVVVHYADSQPCRHIQCVLGFGRR